MILATALVLQRLLTFNISSRESVVRTVILWISVTAFSILHCRINDLNVHSTVFGAMILYIGHGTRVMMRSLKDTERKERAGRLVRWGSSMFF
jgi:Ceramidase